MPTDAEWQRLFAACPRDFQVTANSYRRVRFEQSYCAPVVLGCSDGEDYVVKSLTDPAIRRAICNDQVIGHVAAALVAPVPVVKIVNITPELIAGEPDLASVPAGPAHGSRYMPNASKTRQGFAFQDLPENRQRFALLAIMYGLAKVDGDHQFFYEDGSNRVWSFDHSHFFPGGPDWTIASLAGSGDAIPDPTIASNCKLTVDELRAALANLGGVTVEVIAAAVASADSTWGLNDAERLSLAQHLERRSTHLQR